MGTGVDRLVKFDSKKMRKTFKMWPMKVNQEHGQVIFIRPNSFLHDDRWPDGTPVTLEVMENAVAAGNTVVVHNLEIYWKSVGLFCEQLAELTNLYAQANLYYSPPGQPVSVSPHQDAQSVFIVQLEGRKQWTLFAARQPLGLKPQLRGKAGDLVRREEMGEQLLAATLEPGDVLWIPRATFHSTSTGLAAALPVHSTSCTLPAVHSDPPLLDRWSEGTGVACTGRCSAETEPAHHDWSGDRLGRPHVGRLAGRRDPRDGQAVPDDGRRVR